MLASGGMRAVEATAVRLKDIDFSVTPTKIHLRPEYTKTKTTRDFIINVTPPVFAQSSSPLTEDQDGDGDQLNEEEAMKLTCDLDFCLWTR